MFLFLDVHFVEKVSSASELVYDEQHVADIYVDASLKIRLEDDITAHCLPVAVERKADELALCIEDVTS